MWRVTHLTLGLVPPNNNRNQNDIVLNQNDMNSKERLLLYVGTAAMLCVVWLNRNDIVFSKAPILSYMQVIYI
jgi:hypothetical protein